MLSPLPSLKDLPLSEWLSALEEFAEAEGYFEPLGEKHTAILLDRNPTLIVTFETVASARARADRAVPLGHEIAQLTGWSSLCILAHEHTWFRDQAIYRYFDQLIDQDFFDEFDQVVFYGAGMCGYAAAAYSVAAPGSTVITLAPQATLDMERAEWDARFIRMRRTDFTDRYGYAPDMTEAAERTYVLYDPENEYDAMHASLFSGANVTRRRLRRFEGELEAVLERMGILFPVIVAAGKGELTPHLLNTFLRRRRQDDPYLRGLLMELTDDGRTRLAIQLCKAVLRRSNSAFFEKRLEALIARNA